MSSALPNSNKSHSYGGRSVSLAWLFAWLALLPNNASSKIATSSLSSGLLARSLGRRERVEDFGGTLPKKMSMESDEEDPALVVRTTSQEASLTREEVSAAAMRMSDEEGVALGAARDEEFSSNVVGAGHMPDVDKILNFSKGLKAHRWQDRAQAAQFAANIFGDGAASGVHPATQITDACDKVLQLMLELALKDLHWKVRLAAVESAVKVITTTRELLPADLFAKYAWGVLATCLDQQPEVQVAASKCVLWQLLPASFKERHVIVQNLCDQFVAAASLADTWPLKLPKLSYRSEVTTGLDSLQDGEVLLAGITAVIHLQLLPLPTSNGFTTQQKQAVDRIPLLVVAASVALDDANRRKSRQISQGLMKLLRHLGRPCYRESLLAMFNSMEPVYLVGPFLAQMYLKVDVIDESCADVLKTVKIGTMLRGLSFALEPSCHADCTKSILSDDQFVQNSKASGFSQASVVALQQIVEMLKVSEDLTKTLSDQDKEVKLAEFIQSSLSLLTISTHIIKQGSCHSQDVSLPPQLLEDLVLCCSTFAIDDWQYQVPMTWTSKELHELSFTLLTSLSEIMDATLKTGPNRGLLGLPSMRISSLVSKLIPSLLPRLKQVIQGSSGVGDSTGLHNLSPDGSVGSSIISACQMHWILRQLEGTQLDQHCQLVMPCALTALDHFSPEVKRQAMRSFIHLALHMDPAELHVYKDVVLDAVLRSLIGSRDLWKVSVRMAVVTATHMEGKNPRASWYGRLLSEMLAELERQRDERCPRIVWLQEVLPLINAMGLVLVAHFKRLLPLLFHWLHARDDETCILTLTMLQNIIPQTWPRIPAHVQRISKELMVVYQNLNERKLKSEIHEGITGTCHLISMCVPKTFEAILLQDKDGHELVSFVKKVLGEKCFEA